MSPATFPRVSRLIYIPLCVPYSFIPLDRQLMMSHPITVDVIPILVRVLSDTVKKRITRSAVLSKDVIHIRGSWGFDLGTSPVFHRHCLVI